MPITEKKDGDTNSEKPDELLHKEVQKCFVTKLQYALEFAVLSLVELTICLYFSGRL